MTRLSTAFVALPALLSGCAVDQPQTSSTAGPSYEEWKALVPRDPASGKYILDWDIAIRGEDHLYKRWQSEQSGQGLSIATAAGADIKWNDTQKLNLTYCISNAFGATNKPLVVAAMKGASDDGWEKFGNVNFIYVPEQDATCTATNTNVVFDVTPVNSNGAYLAAAFFPNEPRNDRNVFIDGSAFTSNYTLQNILTHELGHTLGFIHEHYIRPGQTANCSGNQPNRNLEGYDQASTMHYPQCGAPGNTLALSVKDKTGIALVYGESTLGNVSPTASITIPTNGQNVDNSFRVEAMIVDTNLKKVELFIDGAATPALTLNAVSPNGAAIFDNVAIPQNGEHTLVVKATDGPGLSTQQQVAVMVGKSGDLSGGKGGPAEITGGCNTGSGSAGLLLSLGVLGIAIRRRRYH